MADEFGGDDFEGYEDLGGYRRRAGFDLSRKTNYYGQSDEDSIGEESVLPEDDRQEQAEEYYKLIDEREYLELAIENAEEYKIDPVEVIQAEERLEEVERRLEMIEKVEAVRQIKDDAEEGDSKVPPLPLVLG